LGKRISALPWSRLEPWLEALDNWETCDQLASNVSGAIVAANLGLMEQVVALTGSDNRWKRRFALATAVELNHKGRSQPELTLQVCHPLLADPEPLVRKAVGWALREASKKAETRVFEFLLEQREQMPASVLREAAEKLRPEHQQRLFS
jgi:3-methyladenine DNA glycosylase AlkD